LDLFNNKRERRSPGALPGAKVLRFRSTEVHRCHGGGGAPEWSVRFRPLLVLAGDTPEQFSQVCIDGTAAANVRQVRVWVQAESVFAMDSHLYGGARSSSAGEILLAMAQMAGQAGMCIAARDLGRPLSPKDTLVQLRLRATDLDEVMNVRVLAR